MPDSVNEQDSGALAAEFVLGTLDAPERARANDLLGNDDQFRLLVRTWERRFGELHLMVEPVEPPALIWQQIKAKIGGTDWPADSDVKIAWGSSFPTKLPEASPAAERPQAAERALTLDALEAELRQAGLAGTDPVAGQPDEAALPADGFDPAAATPEVVEPVAEPVVIAPAEVGERHPAPRRHEAARDPHASLRRWRLAAVIMTIAAVALASLLTAWRYAPEHLPPQFRADNFLNIRNPAPPRAPVRPPAPPESRFDE